MCYCRAGQVAQMRELYPDAEIVTDVAGGLNSQRTALHTGLQRDARCCGCGDHWPGSALNSSSGWSFQSDASPESELTEDLLASRHTVRLPYARLRRYRSAIAQDPSTRTNSRRP